MEAIQPGTQLGQRYRLMARRASGATATVWSAQDMVLSRTVAVKILHPHLADDPAVADRFSAEARLVATVSHPGLVAVYDTLAGPPPAIVLEWIDGLDLRQRLDTPPRLPIETAVTIIREVADALDHAHRAGLIHRDVKPANIMVRADGAAKLGDFGIATDGLSDRTRTGIIMGTAKYLAPEQVKGTPVDARTDIYALCVVAYEALCGQVPFEREGDLPTAIARLEGPPPSLRTLRPEVDPGLEAVILKGLQLDAADRYPTAALLRDALTPYAASSAPLRLPDNHQPGSTEPPPSASDATVFDVSPSVPPLAPLVDATVINAPVAAPPPDPPPVGKSNRQRKPWWRIALALGITALAALVAVALITDSISLDQLLNGNPLDSGQPPVVSGAQTFDPEGTGPAGENDELISNVIDGDPETSWRTERYEQRDLGTKSGVGAIVTLEANRRINRVTVQVGDDRSGWVASVYLRDSPGATLADWGEPVGTIASENPSLDINGTRGRAVLVWLTDLGQGPTPIWLELAEITIE